MIGSKFGENRAKGDSRDFNCERSNSNVLCDIKDRLDKSSNIGTNPVSCYSNLNFLIPTDQSNVFKFI